MRFNSTNLPDSVTSADNYMSREVAERLVSADVKYVARANLPSADDLLVVQAQLAALVHGGVRGMA